MELVYTQKQYPKRSKFWLKIHENNDATTISANEMVKKAINIRYPSLEHCNARRGWKPMKTGSGDSLWIPDFLMDWGAYEELREWAEIAGKQCIWLSTNSNTKNCFQGNELDFCVAYDWYSLEPNGKSKTPTGEAEFQMKYSHSLSAEDERHYGDMLKKAIKICCDCLPYNCRTSNFVVTAIPADVSGQTKLAWKLAEYAAEILGIPMVPLPLAHKKPEMKNMPIGQKAGVWQSIFSNPYCFSPSDVRCSLQNRNVLIVDDLYQSGSSIWCLAEYLKNNMGVKIVQGVTVVKTMSDGDNL